MIYGERTGDHTGFIMARCRNFSEVAVVKTVRVLLKLKYLDIS